MIYCDTSYLVRLYLDEAGSAEVRRLCAAHPVATALHAKAEVPAALHRAFRERRMDLHAFLTVMDQFEMDSRSGGFEWLDLAPRLYEGMAGRFATLPSEAFLRAADALHLSCAASHGFAEVWSNDRHLLAAATHFGLRGRNAIPG